MNSLINSATAYLNLNDITYTLILGKKGISEKINLSFEKSEYAHIAGLHKLKDIRTFDKSRDLVFDDIVNQRIDFEKVLKSKYYPQYEERILLITYIERILDDSNTIFRYIANNNPYSKIDADFLIIGNVESSKVYIFLKQRADGTYFVKSLFKKNIMNYEERQPKWNLLYKEKYIKSEKKRILLYKYHNYQIE